VGRGGPGTVRQGGGRPQPGRVRLRGAELVKGKCAGVPVAVVRGYPGLRGDEPDGPGAAVLVRPAAQDLFPLGTAEAHAAGLRAAATLPDGSGAAAPDLPPGSAGPDPAVVDRALRSLGPRLDDRLGVAVAPGGAAVTVRLHGPDAPWDLVRFGADLHRLRAALAAEGIDSTVRPLTDSPPSALLELAGPSDPDDPH
ncbi:MAG TPA: hypothetical protein VNV66_22365, partial [Pilimelia sp.]|nr:hypothetical protein [Pilimelia sp.]